MNIFEFLYVYSSSEKYDHVLAVVHQNRNRNTHITYARRLTYSLSNYGYVTSPYDGCGWHFLLKSRRQHIDGVALPLQRLEDSLVLFESVATRHYFRSLAQDFAEGRTAQ